MTNTSYSSQSTPQLTSDDLCSFTTNLCGVLMAKPIHATPTHSTHTVSKEPQLITTETTARNLHAVALALSIGAPTLLEGVTGAGKTTLVEELAIRTGRGDRKYMCRDISKVRETNTGIPLL
jgi:excinuclease UvrABC ATPase subunit